MKYSFMKINLGIFLMLIFLINSLELSSNVGFESSAQFNENESKKIATFARFANCGKKPLAKTCKECMKPENGYKMFFFFQLTRLKKYDFKFFIHYNDKLKKVVVSFGAPNVNNYKYIKRIYSKGWSLIKKYKIRVEREFQVVYYKKMKKILTKKLNKLKKSGRSKFRFIFTGYSLGGSVATLAAFDMLKSKVLTKGANNLNVYTYGALRIGDSRFVALINSSLTIWRVVKQNDYIVRIPSCYYSRIGRVWRCFTAPLIRKYIIRKTFPFSIYVRKYLSSPNRGPLGRLLILRKQTQNAISNKSSRYHRISQKNMGRRILLTRNQSQLVHLASSLKNSLKMIGSVNRNKNIHLRNAPRRWVKPQILPRGALKRNLVKTYYKYIYYTQPLGVQIFYNTSMSSYQRCYYKAGISNCEKLITLPRSFTVTGHKNYYGINFDECL